MSNLTSREQEILNCLLTGRSNQSIAEEMGISVNTVKTHLKNVYQKMDVSTRQQLIVKVLS